MSRGIRQEQVWGIGLPEEATAAISAALGSGYVLRNFPSGMAPSERDCDRATPLVIFIVREAWDHLPAPARNRLEKWEIPQRVLLLAENQSVADFEEVLEDGFLSAVSEPLTDKKIRDIISGPRKSKASTTTFFA